MFGRPRQIVTFRRQLNAAEEAASRAISLLPEKGQEYLLCQSHRSLGEIYHSKGERQKAIDHFEITLGIASTFKFDEHLFWINITLGALFFHEKKFDDAHTYTERAKAHTTGSGYYLGIAMEQQATIWYRQGRLDDANSEALGALEICEKFGASKYAGRCKSLLQKIERAMAGENPGRVPIHMPNNSLSPVAVP